MHIGSQWRDFALDADNDNRLCRTSRHPFTRRVGQELEVPEFPRRDLKALLSDSQRGHRGSDGYRCSPPRTVTASDRRWAAEDSGLDRRRRSLNLASRSGGSRNITSKNAAAMNMYAGIPVLALARKAIQIATAIYTPIVKGLEIARQAVSKTRCFHPVFDAIAEDPIDPS